MTKVPCERAPDPALAPGRGFAVLGPKMWLKIRSFFRLLGIFSSDPEITSLMAMAEEKRVGRSRIIRMEEVMMI